MGNDLFRLNHAWLSGVIPSLAEQLGSQIDPKISIKRSSSFRDDNDLYFCEERVLEASNQTLQASLRQQLNRTDGVMMPRPMRRHSHGENQASAQAILSDIVDQHHEVLIDYLPAVPVDSPGTQFIKPPYRNLVLFGSLMLIPIADYLREQGSSPWVSLTLVESDMQQLAATCSFLQLSECVDLFKSLNLAFVLHVDEDVQNLQDRLYTQISSDNPTLLYGWQTLRSPVISPELMQLHAWLHAPEGVAQPALNMLGFTTDEVNQTQQALWNALTHQSMRVLAPQQLPQDAPIVIVASGPSLEANLEWLREHQSEINLVSAGSALGALLRAGIKPDAAVFLERGAQVYTDLCDVLADGFSLDGIVSITSSTIDPRVPNLFSHSVFFHRPVAAATCLFQKDQSATLAIAGPQVVNAALESVLCLGARQVLLVGADFAATCRTHPRAIGALGQSPRPFNVPVRGNFGKTVFSDPALLHTAELFNRVIRSVPDCNVLRLGEGAELDATTTAEPSSELVAQFSRSPGALGEVLLALPSSQFDRSDCADLFDNLELELDVWRQELGEAVGAMECWSREFAAVIAPALQRSAQGQSLQRRFLNQLLCQPLFYSAMSLHDVDASDQEALAQARRKFLLSLDLLQALLRHWLAVMRPWLQAPQLPQWDVDWMRRRYAKIENQ